MSQCYLILRYDLSVQKNKLIYMFIFVRKENWLECSFVHLLSSYLTALNSRVFFLQITYISSMDSMLSGELIGPG